MVLSNVSDQYSPQRIPGPGWIEAMLWSAGCHLVQFAVCALLATALLWCATPEFPPTLQETLRLVDLLGWETSFLFTGAASLAALLVIAPLVRWRVGPQFRADLGLRPLALPQIILIVGLVAPLAILSDQVYRWALPLNSALTAMVPALQSAGQFDVMQLVQRQAESADFPILLMALAIAPAITEELVFRGLIGRGLTARWGVRGGVAVTTLLFAAAHGSPAHAFATIPVGLCLHTVYRMTGSLWGAILLHAGNNALAVTFMKYAGHATQPAGPTLVFAASGYLIVVLAMLSETSHPHEGAPFSPRSPRLGRAFPMLAGCSILTYTAVMVWSQFGAGH